MALRRRDYRDQDLPAVQAALARWTAAAGRCGYCHVGDLPSRIYAGLRGRAPVGELVHLWEDGSAIVGVAINGRFDHAFDLFVSPAARGGPAELLMLRDAHTTTQAFVAGQGLAERSVITDVFSCDEVRRDLLAQLGFSEYRLWDHVTERDLVGEIAPPRLPAGYSLRHAASADYGQLAAVRNDAFDNGWTPEQYRDQVMAKPGYALERELLAVAPDGQIAAFTMIWLDQLNQVGLFEPVGVASAHRRLGLARALMLHGLAEMRRAGMRSAIVAHDATNLPARELYLSLGFTKRYETLGYQSPNLP